MFLLLLCVAVVVGAQPVDPGACTMIPHPNTTAAFLESDFVFSISKILSMKAGEWSVTAKEVFKGRHDVVQKETTINTKGGIYMLMFAWDGTMVFFGNAPTEHQDGSLNVTLHPCASQSVGDCKLSEFRSGTFGTCAAKPCVDPDQASWDPNQEGNIKKGNDTYCCTCEGGDLECITLPCSGKGSFGLIIAGVAGGIALVLVSYAGYVVWKKRSQNAATSELVMEVTDDEDHVDLSESSLSPSDSS
jgi:hypothetical protein